MINPFSACTQPSILVLVIKTKLTRKSVVNGGGRQEQVRLANCFRAFVKPYVSGWRCTPMMGSDSEDDSNIPLGNTLSGQLLVREGLIPGDMQLTM